MPKTTVVGDTTYFQPIIRGVQNVGAVQILYRYNAYDATLGYVLPLPSSDVIKVNANQDANNCIVCGDAGIPVAGFRLDSEFLRANPQIASSFVIPILGGGGVALTNNNRTGTLNLVCARVSAPDTSDDSNVGRMIGKASEGIGVKSDQPYWDMVTLAQIQQAQEGGDAYGAQLKIIFKFCGVVTTLTFEGCTIATVDPIGLAGNDAVNYGIAINYLNWLLEYGAPPAKPTAAGTGATPTAAGTGD